MTCFDLQQIISIKYIYSKSFVNSSRKHKETSGFEVFNFTFQWFFCSFSDSRQDLSLRSPTRFKSVLHSPQQEINVFRSSKHNSPRPLLVLLIFFCLSNKALHSLQFVLLGLVNNYYCYIFFCIFYSSCDFRCLLLLKPFSNVCRTILTNSFYLLF